jgi:hypothetical protein
MVMTPRKRRQLLKIRVKISCFYIDLRRTRIKKKECEGGEEGKGLLWNKLIKMSSGFVKIKGGILKS